MPPPKLPQINTQAYSSPYGAIQPHNRSTPSRLYVSPYASPSAAPSPVYHQAQAQEQSVSNQISFTHTTPPVNSETPNGTLDFPLATPSFSMGAKRTVPEMTTPAAKKFKNENYYNNSERLLEAEASPLYKDATNLKMILQHPLAQTSLATSQNAHQLPDTNLDDFASAAADFKEDGRGGRYDHDWAAQAQAASHARRVGAFAEYDTEHFKKYWAADSHELSDEEDEKHSNNGCSDDNKKNIGRRDEFDDDEGGTGGVGGGGRASAADRTLSASGNGYGNNESASGNTSTYGNDMKYGNIRNQNLNTKYGGYSNNVSDSKYNKNRGYNNGSKHGLTVISGPSPLPTPPITPADSKSALIHNSIIDPTDMNDFSQLSMLRYYLPNWEGRGYCDNPNSTYPELD